MVQSTYVSPGIVFDTDIKLTGMDDAEYLRAQALFCLNMSRQMSNREDKAQLEKQAMEYTLRAEQLEEGQVVVLDDRKST